MDEFVDYYKDREEDTAKLADKLIQLQNKIDEEETTVDNSKITWANLRADNKVCKIICGFSVDEFLELFGLVETHMPENVGRGRRSKISKKDRLVMVLCYLKHYETFDKMRVS